jgi:hypothetical protein
MSWIFRGSKIVYMKLSSLILEKCCSAFTNGGEELIVTTALDSEILKDGKYKFINDFPEYSLWHISFFTFRQLSF